MIDYLGIESIFERIFEIKYIKYKSLITKLMTIKKEIKDSYDLDCNFLKIYMILITLILIFCCLIFHNIAV